MAMKVVKRFINNIPVDDLKPPKRNPRNHSEKQIQQLADSFKMFGIVVPIIIDGRNIIVAGHGRWLAAKKLGLKDVPVIQVKHLTPALIRAYRIADNKLAENSSWDPELLALELQEIQALDIEFDFGVLGFEVPEIDFMLSTLGDKKEQEEPELPIVESDEVVSRLGDLYTLGKHRLYCGNHLLQECWKALMGRFRAHAVFADPPYNIRIRGCVSGLGNTQHDEFAMASGEMSEAEFIEYLETLFFFLTFYSRQGALHYICMDWRHQYELLVAARQLYKELKNICVWNKTNGGMGSLYRSKHELIHVYKYGDAPHINNVELGKHGRDRTNVWDYPGGNAFHEHRDEELALHPTCKPVQMIADMMLDCTHRNHLVVDPCVGSGSTPLAGERTGRRVFGMELEPKFVDVTILRWQQETGQEAIHVETGKTFAQLKRKRKEVTHA